MPEFTASGMMVTGAKFDKDKLVVDYAEDISDVANHAKRMRNDPMGGYTEDKQYRRVACIPNAAYLAMIRKYPEFVHGDKWQKKKALHKAMNDPEFSIYRTCSGKV
ncbi:MAG: hypothetical protein E6Q97_26520 [Desulfurellales bacterium]|nr:MAG: hypothetical protein E6Q97_26520 [Desulfurellales bacterium]